MADAHADKLAQIKARAEAASREGWRLLTGEAVERLRKFCPHPIDAGAVIIERPPQSHAEAKETFFEVVVVGWMSEGVAEFVTAARQDVPWLIAETERLREWKAAILSVLNANGYGQMQWAGDKDGWGAAFEYIAWAFREKDKLRAAVGVMERRQVWPQLFGSPGRWGVAVRRCQHVIGTGPVNALLKAEEWFLEHNPSNAPEPDACRELLVAEVERLTAESAALAERRRAYELLCGRVQQQSELLTRRAEGEGHAPPT